MALSGITSLEEEHPLIMALRKGEFEVAIKLIPELNDFSQAAQVLDVLKNIMVPDVWLAAFNNPWLYSEIDDRHLKTFLTSLNEKGGLLPFGEFRPKSDGVMTLVAMNPLWCQMLGYWFFVPLTQNHPKLANYIATNSKFVRFLEPRFLHNLIEYIPPHTKPILKSIWENHAQSPLDKTWTVQAIKYLLLKSKAVRKMIFEDPDFEHVRERVTKEKEQDLVFAEELETVAILDQEPQRVAPIPRRIGGDLHILLETLKASEQMSFEVTGENDSPVLQYLQAKTQALCIDDDTALSQTHEEEIKEEAKPEDTPKSLRRTSSFYFK